MTMSRLASIVIVLLAACGDARSSGSARAPIASPSGRTAPMDRVAQDKPGIRLAAPLSAAGAQTAEPAALPEDVRAFATRREECDHLRGEDSATRDAVDRLEHACRGTDADLARLRHVYARDAAVLRSLAGYDRTVE